VLQISRNKYQSIPLGVTVNNREVYMRYPRVHGRPISDTMLIAGRTGCGKSVIKKLVAWYMSFERPVILLDGAGRDDYLCALSNKLGDNIPSNAKRRGIPGIYIYYPNDYARVRLKYEKVKRPNFAKYQTIHFNQMGFSHGAAIYLRNILNKNKFKKMENLLTFIMKSKDIEYNAKNNIQDG